MFAASPANDNVEGLPGTLARYFVIPEDFCFVLPGHVGLDEGALVEPLAVACKAVRDVGVKPEDRVVVFGAGTVGLLCAAVCGAVSARKVVCVDVNFRKLDCLNQWLGTDVETFRPDVDDDAGVTAQKIVEKHGLGFGTDVVIEATGAVPCVLAGIHVLEKGGRYIQTGLGKKTMDSPVMAVCGKEYLEGSLQAHDSGLRNGCHSAGAAQDQCQTVDFDGV